MFATPHIQVQQKKNQNNATEMFATPDIQQAHKKKKKWQILIL